jgi:hypothetical protein
MREDMFQVIIERPRHYGGPKKPGRPPRELDEAPLRESMSRHRKGTKGLNENLAPLQRFLHSRVGRPWNDVHAEMMAHLSLGSPVQKHVLDHVAQMVARHVRVVDGELFAATTIGPRLLDGWRDALYVCPTTGRLALAPIRRRVTPRPERARHGLGDGCEARRIDGIWYGLELAWLPPPAARLGLRDRLLHCPLSVPDIESRLARAIDRRDCYVAGKWQLSKREIAALGG